MNVYHFEYEHDMKLVGELMVSTPFMGLSIYLPLSVFPYFSSLHETVSKHGFINMFFSLYFLIYGFIYMSFLSLYFLIFSPPFELY